MLWPQENTVKIPSQRITSTDVIFEVAIVHKQVNDMPLHGGDKPRVYEHVSIFCGSDFQQILFFVLFLALALSPTTRLLAQTSSSYDLSGNLLAQSNEIVSAEPQFQQTTPAYSIAASNGLLSVSAPVTGAGPFAYQWLFNGLAIFGATNASFLATNASTVNLGSYQLVARNNAGAVTSAVINVSFDTDHSGLPDAWQMQYFGSLGNDPNADPDGDGVSNYQEYLDGTNPMNARSVKPRLNISTSPGGTYSVTPLKPKYQLGDVVQVTFTADQGKSLIGWYGTNAEPEPESLNITNSSFVMKMNSTAWIAGQFGIPLQQALDATDLVWTTGGNADWFGQTNTTYDGVSAAQSGPIQVGRQTWLQTVLDYSNPVEFGFHWSVSSEEGHNHLSFNVNGNQINSLSGGKGQIVWQYSTIYLPPGTNVLLWVYAQDVSDSDVGWINLDTGWLDQVQVTPLSAGTGTSDVAAWGDDSNAQTNVPSGLTNVVAVAGGFAHSLALQSNGTVVAWGDDSYGQISVPANLSNAVAIAAGGYFSLALSRNGAVAAWGDDSYGECNVPPGLSNVVAMAAGAYHGLALENDGSVVAWGDNSNGQTNVPPGLTNVTAVAAGDYFSVALQSDGTVFAWGDNSYGQTAIPAGLTNVVAIAAGQLSILALEGDGTVLGWGDDSYGQIGIPSGLSNVVAIAAGDYFSLALQGNGAVVAWGDDSYGQTNVPSGLSNVVAIAAGGYHSIAAFNNGSPFIARKPAGANVYSGATALLSVGVVSVSPLTYQWRLNGADLPGETDSTLSIADAEAINAGLYSVVARNSQGTVGILSATLTVGDSAPVILGQPATQAVFLGDEPALSVAATGSLPIDYQWQFDGTNIDGATDATLAFVYGVYAADLGNYQVTVSNAFGFTISSNAALTQLPAPVVPLTAVVAWGNDIFGQSDVPPGLSTVVAIAAGFTHSMALQSNGSVVAWGDNSDGQINVPPGLSNVTAIAAGGYASLALQSNGTVLAWGDNGNGETNVPPGLSNVVAIGGGFENDFALESNGTVAPWGNDSLGFVPPGLGNIIAIAGGGYHSLELQSNGTVLAGGGGNSGETNVPPGLSNVVAIAAGASHSLALQSDGKVVGWGDDSFGEIDVPPGLSNVVAIAAGSFFSLALQGNGAVVAWGDDSFGETNVPTGLSNVVAIAAGGYHCLAIFNDGSPLITWESVNANVYSGTPALLSFGAAGAPPLSYQWTLNGTNLPGATNATLSLPDAQLTNAGSYSVVVGNSLGVAASSSGTLTVIQSPPIIQVQPVSQTVPLGPPAATAAFSVEATGSLPLGYQWQLNGTNIAGATGATLDVANVSVANVGNYRVIMSNSFGVTVSLSAALTRAFSMVAAWGDNSKGETNVPPGLSNVVAIAAGGTFGLALESNGTVVAWGDDTYGETVVPPGLSNVAAVAAGYDFGLALEGNGTVAAWGDDSLGQTDVPPGLTNVVAIAAGGIFNLALESNGTVVAWGDDSSGESSTPPGLSNVAAVAAGYDFALALEGDGTVVELG